MRTMVDRFGRVVVPKAMRERFGLGAGAAVDIEEAGDHVAIRPVDGRAPLASKGGVLLCTGEATGDLEAAVHAARTARGKRAAGMQGE